MVAIIDSKFWILIVRFLLFIWNSKINQEIKINQKVNNVTTIFGNGSATSVNGPVSIATINQPMGISIHPITQEVYIAENGGNIRGWNRTSQTVITVVSLGSYINPQYLNFLNDGTCFISTFNLGLLKLFQNGLFGIFFCW